MIRTKGEAGTGNVVAAMRHARLLQAEIEIVKRSENLKEIATKIAQKFFVLDEEAEGNLGESTDFNPFGKDRATIETEIIEILKDIKRLGRLPGVTFTAGGIATPADAALMMQFGMDGVFVGSNSSLVAPIKLEKKSIVCAGSVITKKVSKKSRL